MNFHIIFLCIISILNFATTNPIIKSQSPQLQERQQHKLIKQQQSIKKQLSERYKRDLFATTGWGAGGVSYSSFYITGKQVKEMQAAQNKNTKENSSDNQPEILEIVQCTDCTTKRNVKQEKETFPQLFSSNGWGPLG